MPTHYQGTAEEEAALNVFIKLTRATESVISRLSEIATHELTVSQFGTLETLYHLGPLCQGEIGKKLLKSSGNMTLVIDNLEKRNLVRRQRDTNDRRQIFVHLTDEGERLITKIFPPHLAAIVGQFKVLSAKEQATLGRLLRKVGTGNGE